MNRLQGVSVATYAKGKHQLIDPLHRYSSNGAQINRPEDGDIAQSIRENLEPWPSAWQELQASEYLHDTAYQQLLSPYTSRVKEYAVSMVCKQWHKT